MPTHFPWPSITCVVSASELRTTSGAALWPHHWDERLRRHQPRPYLAGLRRDSVEVVTAPILSVLRSWAPQRTCLPHGFSSDLMGSSSDCLVALQGGPQPAVLVAARPTPPDRKTRNVGVAKARRHDKRRVAMSGRFPDQSEQRAERYNRRWTCCEERAMPKSTTHEVCCTCDLPRQQCLGHERTSITWCPPATAEGALTHTDWARIGWKAF